ncbi:MAG: 4Fe-4S binding protein [Deltaproteobacteria bacterium]|nr:4Fe-4S binding protein [Deltaproteobacteria bacterium]
MASAGGKVRLRLIEPADIRLRTGRKYQRLRRACLFISCALTFALPVWHLRSIEAQSEGLARGGRWAVIGEAIGFPDWAPPLVGAPTSIAIVGLELLDPVLAFAVLVSAGPSAQLGIASIIVAVLVVLFGRFFCGWLCPYLPILAASNAMRSLLARLGFRTRDVPLPKRSAFAVLGVLLVASAATGSQILPLVYPPAVIGREAFRAVFYGGLGAGAVILGGAFVFDTFVSRAGFCRYLCPGGAMFALFGALSPVVVKRTASACTDCGLCDQVCNMLQEPMTDRVDAGCDRCGKCVASCPTDALAIGFGTPPLLHPRARATTPAKGVGRESA